MCCSTLKYEFQLKNLKHQDCKADQFYESQWTDNRWVFVIFKLMLLIYWLVFFISGLAIYEDLFTWWTKLTTWGVVSILLYLILSTTLAVYGVSLPHDKLKTSDTKLNTISGAVRYDEDLERNNNKIAHTPPKSDLRWFHKVVWILFEVSCGVAFIITVAYWSLLDANLSAFSINNHLINSILMLMELFFNRIPVRILHFYNLFFLSVTYVVFSLILHGTGVTSAIYPVLDWEQNWQFALGLALGIVLLVSPLIHLVVYCFYSLSKLIAFKFHSKNKTDIDFDNGHKSFSNKQQIAGEINQSYQP